MTTVVSQPAAPEQDEAAPEAAIGEEEVPVAQPTQPTTSALPHPRRHEAMVVAGQGLTIFGLLVAAFFAYLVAVTPLEHGRDQRTLRAGLSRDIEFRQAWVGGIIPEGAPVALIEVPKLGLREVVVEGTTGSQLKKGPGHLRSSSMPGQVGNAVVAGRRLAYGGPFRHLDQLKPGDKITAVTGQGRSQYQVVARVSEVSQNSADVLDDFGDNRLTLVTSTPELRATRRLVATAVLRSPPHPIPAARPTDIRKEELGLHSDRSTAMPLLLWAQVLLLASLGAAWLRRRWRRWPAYLISVPVLALLALLVFDSFAPILPSTL